MPRKTVKMKDDTKSSNCSTIFSPEESQNTVKNDVAYRGYLLHRANELYWNGQPVESVECQIEALCLGFRAKFFSSSWKDDTSFDYDFHRKFLDHLKSLNGKEENVPFTSLDLVLQEQGNHPQSPKEESQAYEDAKSLITKCKELPEEWTVVHLCKDFDPLSANSFNSEIMSSNRGIFVTLLQYPRADVNNHEPICVFLPPLENENPFELIHNVATNQATFMNVTEKTDKNAYWENLRQLDRDYVKLVNMLTKWLGPWMILFMGRPKKSDYSHIYSLVDTFVAKEKLSNRQRVLLSIICSNVDYLSIDDVDVAAREIGQNPRECEKIKKFISNDEEFGNCECDTRFPTIIIVDELLDQFPWELLDPKLGMTRISSLHIFLRLFAKYRDDIKDGYLQFNVNKGTSLINPNGDLMKMEKRISEFLNYWLPQWEQNVQRNPTAGELKNILDSSDVFLYCGHGNALKYIKPQDLIKDTLNCVIMLFGCESIRLKANGYCSEMSGAHLYYHYVLCPLVIGATNTITDYPADQLCTRILSTWFTSKATKHFAHADMKSFKEGKIEFNKSSKPAWEKLNNPSILGIFSDFRCTGSQSVWLRASVILRGLPIWLASHK